jgi:hypothetical protein
MSQSEPYVGIGKFGVLSASHLVVLRGFGLAALTEYSTGPYLSFGGYTFGPMNNTIRCTVCLAVLVMMPSGELVELVEGPHYAVPHGQTYDLGTSATASDMQTGFAARTG